MMGNRKSLKRNYIYNLIYQLLVIILPLVTTPYISRILYADGIGVVSFAESIVSYFVLFASLGVGLYGQREISYYQDDKDKRSEVFWNTLIFKFITSAVILLLYIIVSIFYFKSNIYYIFSISILSVFFDITWFYQGMEEFGKIVVRNIIFKILSIAFIFLFVKSKSDIGLYAFSICFFTFMGSISLWVYLKHYVSKPIFENIKPFKDFRVIISLFIPTIAIQVYTVLDKTMIGIITKSDFENGYYDLSIKISKILLTIITSLGVALIPRVGLLYSNNDDDNLKKLIYKSYRFVWFMGIPLCFGLFMISNNFVPWFLGAGYDKVAILIKILSFLIIIIGLSNVTGMQYLIPTKKQNAFTISVCIGALVNLVLNYILIRNFLSIGAATASVIAECAVTAYQIYRIRKEISAKKILFEGRNYFIAGFFMVLIIYVFMRNLIPSVKNSMLIAIVGAVSYFVILTILKDKFLYEYIEYFRNRAFRTRKL